MRYNDQRRLRWYCKKCGGRGSKNSACRSRTCRGGAYVVGFDRSLGRTPLARTKAERAERPGGVGV